MVAIAFPVRGQSDGVLNSPAIIMTTGSLGAFAANHAGGRYTSSVRCLKCDASSGMVTGHQRTVCGSALAPHRHDGVQIGLVGQWSCGQLVPGGLNRREVADPEVQCHPRAEQAQRHRHQRYDPAPPAAAAPTEHRDGQRQTGQAHPYPERRRRGISREALRIDVPVRPCRQDQADDERHRQPHQSPPSRTPTDGHHQHHRGDCLHRRRQPAV